MKRTDHDSSGSSDRPRRKRTRHTMDQIKELERVFNSCSHPDYKQRTELGKRLGLDEGRIRFWFQNKRTQVKGSNESRETTVLSSDVERLQKENIAYKKLLESSYCPKCIGPDERLLEAENARLKEQINMILVSYPHIASRASQQVVYGIAPYRNLSAIAMEELVRMAQAGEPMWLLSNDGSTERLNEEVYQAFPTSIWPKQLGVRFEASRGSAVVKMHRAKLVQIFMDEKNWSSLFSGIVSQAQNVKVLSSGEAGSFDGAIHMMTASYQVSSPLVPRREAYFLRYCKRHDEKTWAVVDVSLNNLRGMLVPRCQIRPSGCLIEELPNGYSKVVWVEHVEIHDESPIDSIFRDLVYSGLGFGANRWLATLIRQCERLDSVEAIIPGEIYTTPKVKKHLVKLADRLAMDFWASVGASSQWTNRSSTGNLSADQILGMTRIIEDEPGRPSGRVLCGASSFWLNVEPGIVFNYLRDVNSRSKWDRFAKMGGLIEEIAHIPTGCDPGNAVSVIRVFRNEERMSILQETRTDPTGSYIIYATIESNIMDFILMGGDPDNVTYSTLPNGFAIFPDPASANFGSLATVSFQAWDEHRVLGLKPSPENIGAVEPLIGDVVKTIKAELEIA